MQRLGEGRIAMAIATFKRFEKKFIVTREQYERLLPAMLEYMQPDKYCKDGNTYSLVNLYFDNERDDIIRTSVSKPKYKQKLRLRSYGTPESEDATVYLEIKKKFYGTVTKRRVGMTLGEANAYIYDGVRPSKKKYLPNQVLDEIDYFREITPCTPKIYISYDRRAYFMKDKSDVRVTFDDNILTRRYDLDILHGSYGEPLLEDGIMLLEIKVPDVIPMWLTNLLSEEKVYMTSFSKYGKEYHKYVLGGKQLQEIVQ